MRYEKDIPFRSVSFGLFYPAKNGVTRDFAKLALKMSTPLRRYPTNRSNPSVRLTGSKRIARYIKFSIVQN
ncbi:MAG TPA: hypothetical protein DCX97_04525 [Alistipes sp.]|nr:hypothetical protein [Alistipes sp.]